MEPRLKTNLPLKELDLAFDIKECKSVSEIRRKIMEHLEGYAKFLEELIQPEASLAAVIECKLFDEPDKKRTLASYKRLMYLHRQGIEVGLIGDEREENTYIIETLKEWKALREDLTLIIRKLKDAWKDDNETPDIPGYFG